MKRVIVGLLGAFALLGAMQVVPERAGAATDQFTLFDAAVVHNATKYAQPSSTSGPTNWVSPVNYKEGRAYLRFEVTSKPSAMPLTVQLCLWRNEFTAETCSGQHGFSTTGVHWFDLGKPAAWWKLGGVWDFTQPFSPARLMIKDPSRGELLMTGGCGDHCYTGPENLADHVPIRVNASVVVVPKGVTLQPPSSWAGCPPQWSSGCSGTTNTAPTADAGPDLGGVVAGTAVALTGSAADDGRPQPPGVVSPSWSVVSGPGAVSFDDTAALHSTAVFAAPGTYVLQLRVSDGLLAATDTVQVDVVPEIGDRTAVLVASRADPVASDRPYVAWLNALGFGVTVVDDNQMSKETLDAADIVVISSSVDPVAVPAWISAVEAPLVSNEVFLAPKLGLAAKGKELTDQRKVRIVDPASPLAAGLTGTPVVTGSTVIGGVYNLSPNVHVVATTAPAGSTIATVVLAESGDVLLTGPAPDARVGFFLGLPAPPVTAVAGRAMFDAAVSTLTYEAAPPLPWWNDQWRFRQPLRAASGAIARNDAVVEADVDLGPSRPWCRLGDLDGVAAGGRDRRRRCRDRRRRAVPVRPRPPASTASPSEPGT